MRDRERERELIFPTQLNIFNWYNSPTVWRIGTIIHILQYYIIVIGYCVNGQHCFHQVGKLKGASNTSPTSLAFYLSFLEDKNGWIHLGWLCPGFQLTLKTWLVLLVTHSIKNSLLNNEGIRFISTSLAVLWTGANSNITEYCWQGKNKIYICS